MLAMRSSHHPRHPLPPTEGYLHRHRSHGDSPQAALDPCRFHICPDVRTFVLAAQRTVATEDLHRVIYSKQPLTEDGTATTHVFGSARLTAGGRSTTSTFFIRYSVDWAIVDAGLTSTECTAPLQGGVAQFLQCSGRTSSSSHGRGLAYLHSAHIVPQP